MGYQTGEQGCSTPSFLHKLHPLTGIFEERPSQVAFYAKTPSVTDAEATAVHQ